MRKYFFVFQIFNAAYLTVSAQNIGIGTNTPTEKLHINGNIKGDTLKPNAIKLAPNAGAGRMLTSDATGNATWQERSAGGGVGFGSWGDCSMSGVSEYNPIADQTGAALDAFGQSVSISGNFAIVGAPSDNGGSVLEGSASIYQFNGSSWMFKQKLTNQMAGAGDRFGTSVSISGNYAIVGALYDNSTFDLQGSASIYQYNGINWVLMEKLEDTNGGYNDNFGNSVSISGNYAIVGASGDDEMFVNQGSVSIYHYNGSNWVLMQKKTDATGDTDDNFGTSVSISGNFAFVGAYRDDGIYVDQGSVSIYQYLTASIWILKEKITQVNGAAFDNFGASVFIQGNNAIVGAFAFDSTFSNQGSASIYQFNGSNWIFMQKLTHETGAENDNFGRSVSISGDYAIVGTSGDDIDTNINQGSASIFLRVGLEWQKLQYVTDPGGKPTNYFGTATSIDGATKRFLIGASGYANSSGKVVFGKVN